MHLKLQRSLFHLGSHHHRIPMNSTWNMLFSLMTPSQVRLQIPETLITPSKVHLHILKTLATLMIQIYTMAVYQKAMVVATMNERAQV
ncbi:PREDICTED: uncharacterized protein LOC103900667 [Aptenodytes forsteri]|uniref:uncharacterized protein LOC103900667 n=1 Tax=Aptenodytes forsteri TaxID=9233 RepID=UPI000904926D|nr:PREDICTED: uncharacterized protein LOC103900667 [Aptenodytes forsteri]